MNKENLKKFDIVTLKNNKKYILLTNNLVNVESICDTCSLSYLFYDKDYTIVKVERFSELNVIFEEEKKL